MPPESPGMLEMSRTERKDIKRLADSISEQFKHFDKSEVESLIRLFNIILAEQRGSHAETKLDRLDFQHVMQKSFGITEETILERVFHVFDKDNDGQISLTEWIAGLSVLLRGTLEEKIKYCFNIYDLNEDEYIGQGEMIFFLKNSLNVEPKEQLTDEGIKDLVEITLKKMDHDHDGTLSFIDFEKTVLEEHLLLEAFGTCLPDAKTILAFEKRVFQVLMDR